jgi:hypothetical protein
MITAIHGILVGKNKEIIFNSVNGVAGTTTFAIWDQLKNPATNHPFTVEHWLKPGSNIATQQDLINFIPNDSARGFRTVILNGKVYTNFMGNQNVISGGSPITANTWQFTAHSYDGSTCQDFRGTNQEDFTQAATGTGYAWNFYSLATAGMVLGAQHNGLFPFLGGAMDLIRIWSIPRTESELKANMYKILPAGTPGLVAQWSPENNNSANMLDTSGNGNALSVKILRSSIVPSITSPFIY